MAIQETALGETYSGNSQNYLYDWCRRTNNLSNIANYYVEVRLDGATGRQWYRLRDIADQGANNSTDSADPSVIDLSPGDLEVAAEDASDS